MSQCHSVLTNRNETSVDLLCINRFVNDFHVVAHVTNAVLACSTAECELVEIQM